MLEHQATAIITSHSLRELEDTCDQLALLHKGGLVLESDIQNLKTSLFKIQIAFSGDFGRDSFDGIDILHFSKRGSVASMIVRGGRGGNRQPAPGHDAHPARRAPSLPRGSFHL